jgi:uncharacterized hydrophobic protein (TIGR00271 family)
MLNVSNSEPERTGSPRTLAVRLRWIRRLLFRQLPEEESQSVRQHVEEQGQLTEHYALMCALSAGIATIGLLQSSGAVVIGAMLVSPLMSPIARLGFSFASLDARRAQDAARVLLIGAGVGIAIGVALTWLSPIKNATPEIVARTAPTLLDLAVAVLSGLAGGYATVHRRGETAIGVAIATALMPPLATIGYSIAVGRWDFAGGASLLFLTNLAAISFSFALVARVRGVVRPLSHAQFRQRYVLLGVAAFLGLATPLALTLQRVTQEATATRASRQEIARLLSIDAAQIAQLSVSWKGSSPPTVVATAITPRFQEDAEAQLTERLKQRLRRDVIVRLQQIVAADPRAQTDAIIEAAAARGMGFAPGASADLENARGATRAPVLRGWIDPASQEVFLLAAPRNDWSLSQYRTEETRLSTIGLSRKVRILPPYADRLPILFGDDVVALDATQRRDIEDMIWALQRWGVRDVVVEGISGSHTGASRTSRVLANSRAAGVAAIVNAAGLHATTRLTSSETASQLAQAGAARVRAADILPFSTP